MYWIKFHQNKIELIEFIDFVAKKMQFLMFQKKLSLVIKLSIPFF